MRILLLGYSGFLGKYFHKLANEALLDLVLIGRKKPEIELKANSIWIQSDISQLNRAFRRITKVDVVVNLIWEGLPNRDISTNQKNLTNQLSVFKALESMNFEKLLCAGSNLEYAESDAPIKEDGKTNLTDDFALTKISLYREAQRTFNCVLWPRIFFSYGIGQHSKSLLNFVFENLKNANQIQLQDPNGMNDYIHASDVSSALLSLIQTPNTQGIYNVGTGLLTSNQALANMLEWFYRRNEAGESNVENHADKVGSEDLLNFVANKKLYRAADISKIASETGWTPKVGLGEGVQEFLRFRSL
jgi:UDP-glucose 4-epimerase